MPNDFDPFKPTPIMKNGQPTNKRSHLFIGWLVVLGCFGVVLAFVGALLVLAWRLALG